VDEECVLEVKHGKDLVASPDALKCVQLHSTAWCRTAILEKVPGSVGVRGSNPMPLSLI
jgi:hypothetical protein